jgi:ketosteroid isomerase-like protein
MLSTRRSICNVVVMAAALTFGSAASADEATTKQVLDHHLQAFGDLDLEEILADYTDESVLLTADGPVQGMDQLKGVFEAFFAEFGKPGTTFEMKQKLISGDVAYIVWTAKTADNVYEVATDTFVIDDGKIEVQSFTAKTTPAG